jgi:diguanylate cyclase (GGDEF)-like protein/PAS domain S-box-containing protein
MNFADEPRGIPRKVRREAIGNGRRADRRTPWIILAVGLATIGGILGFDLHLAHRTLTENEGERLSHAAEVVGSTLSRRLQATANALDAIAPDLIQMLEGEISQTAANSRMESMVSAMSGVRTLLLVGTAGEVLASNRPLLIGLNFHEDERYRHIRENPTPERMHISRPFVTPHDVFTITAGKAVLHADGRFAGYAIAAIDPEFFSQLLAASVYADDMRTQLIHGAGKIIHSVPDDARLVGFDLGAAPDSLFNRHLASGAHKSLISGTTASTGEQRIAAVRSITPASTPTDFPLVVSLTRNLDAVHAPWRRDLWVRSLLFGALALISAAGLWAFQRHKRRSEADLAAEEAERARLEQALREDRQYLAEVVWGTDAGTWEWNLLTDAVHLNERWAGLLGYTLDELAPISIDTWRRLTHPEDLTMLEGLLARLIPGRIEFIEARVRMHHKDGHWVWILDRGRAVERDAEGKALRLAGAHLDISAAQDAEIRTRAALRYARSLLEASLDPIMTIGLDGRITDVNEAAEHLTGLERTQLTGRDFGNCFTAPDLARDGCRRVFSLGRVRDLPLTLQHVDGSVTEVLINASVFRDEDDRIAGAFAAARDLTQLRRYQRALERTNAETHLLGQLRDMLQSCHTVLEGVPIMQSGLQQLFPDARGCILMIDASGHVLEEVSCWGQDGQERDPATIAPLDCWALRRGHVHDIGFDHSINPRCKHLAEDTRTHMCLPLRAQGQALGVIHLIPDDDPETREHARELAEAVTDSLSLSLANLRLRENLLALSMCDPLTGLYNRRFMEEGLEREIGRAARGRHALAVALLDLDHFKHFNDNYGHDAGDTVLTAFAHLMHGFRVGNDIACRYGGEEFLLVLTDIDAPQALDRLDRFRESVGHMNLQHHGQALPTVSVSIGVALYPKDGDSGAKLIRAADEALYRAKSGGRNQVVLAGPSGTTPTTASGST